jgi:hypothetical protein
MLLRESGRDSGWSRWPVLLWLAVLLSLAACQVKLVADYDQATFEGILQAAKKVDLFYGQLLERSENARPYAQFTTQYVDIESDLRSLVTRNQARPLNQESTKISETILNLWLKYKAAHQANDGYKTALAKLDRKRFTRLFNAAASAEQAKQLSPGDRDSEKQSSE